PHATFVSVHDIEFGRLADNGKIKLLTVMLSKMLRPPLRSFLAHQTHEGHFDAERRDPVTHFPKRPQHARHGSLGITGAAPPDLTIRYLTTPGIDGHTADSDRIGMRREQ